MRGKSAWLFADSAEVLLVWLDSDAESDTAKG